METHGTTEKPTVTLGRPKGRQDKLPRKKRNDSSINTAIPDDSRQRIICHDIMVRKLGKLSDPNDYTEVNNRIDAYLDLCVQNIVAPTVAGLALALGIDRRTLWTWISGKTPVIKNPDVMDTLKTVYSSIEAQYEEMLTEGKIIPVSAIFLMKNNHGYKDQTEYTFNTNSEIQETTQDIVSRAGLLTDE